MSPVNNNPGPPDERDEHLPLREGPGQPARRLHPLRVVQCDAGRLFNRYLDFGRLFWYFFKHFLGD